MTNTRVRLVLILGLADLVVRDIDVKAVRAGRTTAACVHAQRVKPLAVNCLRPLTDRSSARSTRPTLPTSATRSRSSRQPTRPRWPRRPPGRYGASASTHRSPRSPAHTPWSMLRELEVRADTFARALRLRRHHTSGCFALCPALPLQGLCGTASDDRASRRLSHRLLRVARPRSSGRNNPTS